MRTNSGNLQSSAHFLIGEHWIWRVLSLRGLRSGRLLAATNADCRPRRANDLSLALWPPCHTELWVSHFESKSQRHSMEGTTQRLQRTDSWGQLRRNRHSTPHDIHRLCMQPEDLVLCHNSPSLQQMDKTQLIFFKIYSSQCTMALAFIFVYVC
jgi:hypothetical protein